ncbi:MAG TPA: hypothetical protein PKN87_00710 [Syntrophomonadaceae bacterium]|nr:hypothetical protein [Syntrophomonadaceae bacterium]HPR93197.1 hypothetical protein [Syntrophomonadaceae bacterium]
MRSLFRKLDIGQPVSNEEHQQLMEYIEKLSLESPESWQLFYDRYAAQLFHQTSADLDDFINFLCLNPELIDQWEKSSALFPPELQPFLLFLKSTPGYRFKSWLKELLKDNKPQELPVNREKDIVIKYEEANPYKESGIKAHFDRLSRYPFISRLQTYRYLSRSKAVNDRIEYLQPDQLGGIFTNKEKSIYYYIYLTESDEKKAHYVCSFLNKIFYDK